MVKCCVKMCRNYSEKIGLSPNIRFYSFPRNPELFEQWVKAAKCGKTPLKVKRCICSVHFAPEAIRLSDRLLNIPPAKQRLSETAVPTLHLPGNMSDAPKPLGDRENRLNTRKRRREVADLIAEHSAKRSRENIAEKHQFVAANSASTQTDPITDPMIKTVERLKKQLA